MQRLRGGRVFKARRLCVSLNSSLESNKGEEDDLHNKAALEVESDCAPSVARLVVAEHHRAEDVQLAGAAITRQRAALLSCHSQLHPGSVGAQRLSASLASAPDKSQRAGLGAEASTHDASRGSLSALPPVPATARRRSACDTRAPSSLCQNLSDLRLLSKGWRKGQAVWLLAIWRCRVPDWQSPHRWQQSANWYQSADFS